MLTIHHLCKSQSERILWLCEELGLPYELKRYEREPVTILAPPELKGLHPMGAAPLITDGAMMLAESGAIVEYVIAKYGNGRLSCGPEHADFADYLYWFHFANGNFLPKMSRNMMLHRLKLPADHPVMVGDQSRLVRALDWLDKRLAGSAWLAGAEFTAADIMNVFGLTTMRLYMPLDLAPWPHILAYLRRIGERPAYQAAMRRGDPDLVPMLS